ncbi:MAG: (2Fe-2S)-binding protein [Anaerolineales bacterium]|jgi:sarcosine oxidase subunit alpha
MRIEKSTSLLPEVKRGRKVQITVDGKPIEAFEGETVAAAMMASGFRVFRTTAKDKMPRGMYCGMGICFECLVTINGVKNVRACLTPVTDGMTVVTQEEVVA